LWIGFGRKASAKVMFFFVLLKNEERKLVRLMFINN
jgi:hypothetical protein